MPREMPGGWRVVPLSAVCRPAGIQVPVLSTAAYKLMGVRWYGNGTHQHTEIAGDKLKSATLNKVKSDYITYNKMWVSKGAFGIVSSEHDGLYATSEYPMFEASDELNPNFAKYYMKLSSFRNQAIRRCRGTTSRARLNPQDFLKLMIHLPPLLEQHRIADILSSVDEAIQATQAVIEQTRTVKQGVLHRLLTKGIGHAAFKQTEIGKTPEAWEVRPLAELCKLTNGNGFRPPDWSEVGLPIIRIQNLNGSKVFNYFAGELKPKWIIQPGDLLFSWAGVRGVSFGPHLWDGPTGVLNQHIFKVSPMAGIEKKWLYYTMELVTGQIEAKAHGFKDSLVHVHKGDITGQLIGVPPISEQKDIVARLGALDEAEHTSMRELAAVIDLKSALMSDLLTGRMRVQTDLPMAAE